MSILMKVVQTFTGSLMQLKVTCILKAGIENLALSYNCSIQLCAKTINMSVVIHYAIWVFQYIPFSISSEDIL